MKLYDDISEYYREIFPVADSLKNFFKSLAKPNYDKTLLDVGCGTGDFIFNISDYYSSLVGVDIDKSMLSIAKKRQKTNSSFVNSSMLNLERNFNNQTFDIISCIGNTLVHLNNIDEINSTFKQMAGLMSNNSCLIIQIINYDRIVDNKINFLPTIETQNLIFKREYELVDESRSVIFNTLLKEKSGKFQKSNSIKLLTLRLNELKALAEYNGLGVESVYSGFDKANFDIGNSVRTVVKLIKS
ncbi:MAG: class I SAM-dependent methyltransferase [Marinifilaceae bacterium]|jgi:SAM-dependent methyltransferase|nr:class I SAM-dependent methyltransferase [Marinifilaceae bacterium]